MAIDVTALDPPVQDSNKLDIYSFDPVAPKPDQSVLEQRSLKYSVATGQDQQTVLAQLMSDKEAELRRQTVQKNMADKVSIAQDVTSAYVEAGGNDPAVAKAMAQVKPENPQTVLEDNFAKKLSDMLIAGTDNKHLENDIKTRPDLYDIYYNDLTDTIAKNEGFLKIAQDQEAKVSAINPVHKLDLMSKQAIPFYNWYNISGLDKTSKSILPYNNLRETIDHIRSLPRDEAIQAAKIVVDNLDKTDPLIALDVAQKLSSFSQDAQSSGNILELANIPGWGTAGKFVKGFMKSVEKSVLKSSVSIPEVLSSAGRTIEATRTEILMGQSARAKDAASTITAEIPNIMNPNRFLQTSETYFARHLGTLRNYFQKNTEKIQLMLNTPNQVATMTKQMEKVALDAAESELRAKYRTLSDAILRVDHYTAESNTARIAHVEASVGSPKQLVEARKILQTDIGAVTKDNYLFDTPEQALFTAQNLYHLKDFTYNVAQEGDGFVLRLAQDVNERSSKLWDKHYADTSNFTTNRSLALWDIFRGQPADVNAAATLNERATALHGSALSHEILGEIAEPIKNLKDPEAMRKLLVHNRDTPRFAHDPDSRGMFYNNIDELDKAMLQFNGRHATVDEVKAYHAFVRLHELDYVLRNISIAKDLSRQGVEKVVMPLDTGEKIFQAKRLSELPAPDMGVKVMIVNPKNKAGTVRAYTDTLKKKLDELMKKENFSVYQVAAPMKKEIDGKNSITFVVTKHSDTSPIDFKQLDSREGFHSAYAPKYKVVQGGIEKSGDREFYTGDNLAFFTNTPQAAEKVREALQKAQALYKKGDTAALAKHIGETLPISVNQFVARYKSGHFNVDHNFFSVETNKRAGETPLFRQLHPNATDFRDNPYNLDKVTDKTFTQERDRIVQAINETQKGLEISNAEQLDPILVQNRELNRLVRSQYYDNLSLQVAEAGVEQFGVRDGLLVKPGGKLITNDDLRRNPIYWFHNAEISSNATQLQRKQIEAIRQHHKNLLGVPTKLEQEMNTFTYKLVEGTLNKMGMQKLVPQKEIPLFTKGIQFMRAVAFVPKFAFYTPWQLFVQGAGLSVIHSISPKYALQSTLAASMMHTLQLTASEEVVDHAATVFSKLNLLNGMTKEQFKESFRLFKDTGFDLIKASHSFTDVFSDPPLRAASNGKRYLDNSLFFFKHAEKFVNTSAWNTAYAEYIAKNPKLAGKLTEEDGKYILNRAKDLSGMMQRDRNATWQAGVGGLTTQFYGYYARMWDLATGSRISTGEKIKLLAGLSVLFGNNYLASAYYAAEEGDPGAILDQFNPINGYGIREYAMQNGIDINSGVLGLLANGIPQQVFSTALGENVNVAERYGPGSFLAPFDSIAKEFRDNENPLIAILKSLSGPSDNIANGIIADALPVFGDLVSPQNMSLDVMTEHIKRLASNVSTAGAGIKLVEALETGVYYSKNGAGQAEGVTPLQALVYALGGLQPQSILDHYNMSDLNRKTSQRKSSAIKDASPLMRMYLDVWHQEGNSERTKRLSAEIDIILRASGMDPIEINNAKIKMLSQKPTIFDDTEKTFIRNGTDPTNEMKRRELVQ